MDRNTNGQTHSAARSTEGAELRQEIERLKHQIDVAYSYIDGARIARRQGDRRGATESLARARKLGRRCERRLLELASLLEE